MLSPNTPPTGNGIQRAAHNHTKKAVALVAAIALGTGVALAMPFSASAAGTGVAYAQGQFLSGTVGGVNLDALVGLQAATARNNGSQGTQVSRDPLSASVLGNTVVNDPNGQHFALGNYVNAGALSQYAQAAQNGSSMASSGAVGNDGSIGVGSNGGDPTDAGSATVNLDSLLGARFANVLTNVTLQAKDVAAQANAQGSSASGAYTLNGLTLNFTSPAIANLGKKVDAALAPAQDRINALDGSTGELADSMNSVVSKISPILNLVGAHAKVTAKVDVNLDNAVESLLDGTYKNNAVTFDLSTGNVSVDLAKLEGGDLNNEPAGTEVLSTPVVNKVLDGITSTVSTLGDQIVDKVTGALVNAKVDVHAAVTTATPQAPILSKVCTNGLLGSLLCSTTSKVLPPLNTSLDVNVDGTVGGLTKGTAAVAAAHLKLLGVPVDVSLGALVNGIGGDLTNNLLDGSSAVSDATNGIDQGLVQPAVDGLLADNGTSVDGALTDALSVTLNDQDKSATDGSNLFTETALRVTALPAAGTDGAATINLAQATVGPNVTTIVPTSPGSPSNPGGGLSNGSGNSPISGAALGNLAFTGVNIAGLVATLLALLAAGAYLVREGYRRNHRGLVPRD